MRGVSTTNLGTDPEAIHGNEEEKGWQEEGGEEEEIRKEAFASRRCARSALAAVAGTGAACLRAGSTAW
jgi:hypothetical protein